MSAAIGAKNTAVMIARVMRYPGAYMWPSSMSEDPKKLMTYSSVCVTRYP